MLLILSCTCTLTFYHRSCVSAHNFTAVAPYSHTVRYFPNGTCTISGRWRWRWTTVLRHYFLHPQCSSWWYQDGGDAERGVAFCLHFRDELSLPVCSRYCIKLLQRMFVADDLRHRAVIHCTSMLRCLYIVDGTCPHLSVQVLSLNALFDSTFYIVIEFTLCSSIWHFKIA